ncbi:acyl carrier protein [Actinacidiphila rubida]|uniref:Acyl carrier protein n=1 Tax=Actinacidiphila rubida TaxID=310780 RepID=A0A1H8KD58_9ACTN|nr:phosphopantetheine-binding protein [Actinacidiphila rubida]SEN90446.1 acyl carrier protein [Actinacidiphila rubida]
MSQQLLDCLIQMIVDKYGLDAAQLSPHTRFEDLEFDSLVMLELAVALELRLGIPVSDEELLSVESIGEAVDLLDAKVVAA